MSLLQDARYALRSMARTPGFSAVAILMIALGTGANAAMFSVIDAVMLRSPFADPDRVAIVAMRGADGRQTSAISLAQYQALAASGGVFDHLAAVGSGLRPIVTGAGDPKRFNNECVTAGMFQVLGTQPIAGRPFTREEDRPGAPPVVVLSYQFWQREMHGARDVIGRALTLNGTPVTIVGIMPRGFGGPYSRNNNDGWLPAGPTLAGSASPGCSIRGSVNAFARVKAGLAFDAASRLATDAAGVARLEDWQGRTGGRIDLVPLEKQTLSDLRDPLFALLGAVGLVLLIACANVSNLQMERVFGRRSELGVRMALGASRARIVRQTLVESLLLSIAGCAAGILFASLTLDLLVGLLPAAMPRLSEVEMNARILGTTIVIACAAGVSAGVLPALRGTSGSLMDDLRSSSRSATGAGWSRRALVVVQVSLSLILLVGATLMISTFATLRPSSPGFEPADKLTATLRLQGGAARNAGAVFNASLARLRAIPGLRSVEASTYLPMSGSVSVRRVASAGVTHEAWAGIVTPGYFAEMEIPVVRGRGFTAADSSAAAPVAVVNEAFARRWWPSAEPVGQVVDVELASNRREARQVVGVIRDTRSMAGDLRARAELYTPLDQSETTMVHFIVRAERPGDPRLAAGVRSAIALVDPAQVVDRIVPMQDLLDARVATWRFGAWLLGLFAAMAILLTAVGLSASLAWWVTQRRREIGVRMALGAHPRQVLRLVLRQGFALAAVGVCAGLAGAAASTRLIAGGRYGVTPLDPRTFALSAVGMLAIAAIASYLPARRATRIDPLVALREP